ncbi:MAG: hypothetical protein FJW90_02985, partial [Actinobacteria bacterium]|nr:hypothetical protein [Actinomycetota bacterium]
MMGSRRGFRERRRRKKASRAKLATKTEAVRAEAHRAAAGRSTERRKARLARHRAQLGELWTWTKGVGLELRSRARLGARSLRNRAAPVA